MSEGSREYIRGDAPTCASRFVRESKDPCKMAYSIVALVNRDLFTIEEHQAQARSEEDGSRLCARLA